MKRDAVIDATGMYRYQLLREWDDRRPRVGFVMLNPSTADGTTDDPTIRRCIGFAQRWGYGSLVVGNLFAYRATSPRQLFRVGIDNPEAIVGPENDPHLRALYGTCERVVVAWGTNGRFKERDEAVLRLLGQGLYCLGTTLCGAPLHPLYRRADTVAIPYPHCLD